MMDVTDRHCRYFLRQLAPGVRLYTEMITARAVLRGDHAGLLGFDAAEHPVAVQLAGHEPARLAEAARIAADFGYDEINLNVGCPSSRVQDGRFGACLMTDAGLVARCVAAMSAAVAVPVTVKTRIGVDDQDSYEFLAGFVRALADAGCRTFIVHARKAILRGLSPQEEPQPSAAALSDLVYRLKERLSRARHRHQRWNIDSLEDSETPGRGRWGHARAKSGGRSVFSDPGAGAVSGSGRDECRAATGSRCRAHVRVRAAPGQHRRCSCTISPGTCSGFITVCRAPEAGDAFFPNVPAAGTLLLNCCCNRWMLWSGAARCKGFSSGLASCWPWVGKFCDLTFFSGNRASSDKQA